MADRRASSVPPLNSGSFWTSTDACHVETWRRHSPRIHSNPLLLVDVGGDVGAEVIEESMGQNRMFTPDEVRAIRQEYNTNCQCCGRRITLEALAQKYHTYKVMIHRIVTFKYYKEVKDYVKQAEK